MTNMLPMDVVMMIRALATDSSKREHDERVERELLKTTLLLHLRTIARMFRNEYYDGIKCGDYDKDYDKFIEANRLFNNHNSMTPDETSTINTMHEIYEIEKEEDELYKGYRYSFGEHM